MTKMSLKVLILTLQRVFHFLEYLWEVINFRIFGLGEMEEEPVMNKKIAIVTGSNTGIGKQIVKELADRGATVILACRNLNAGREAMEDIKTTTAFAKVEVMELDLEDLGSIRKFATQVKSQYPEINLLINNAGLCSYSNELQRTKHNFEMHMGVNHVGHFLLTNLLLDNIKAGAPSRIVTISSATVLHSHLRLDDLMMENFRNPTVFTGITRLPYNNSKMANALFTKELGRRLEGSGVTTYCLCPGIVKTGVFRDSRDIYKALTKIYLAVGGISIQKAVTGVLYCALSRKCEHETGKFYRFGQIYRRANRMLKVRDAEELWRISENLVK